MTTSIEQRTDGYPTATPGLFLRMAREAAGLRQQQLAERLGVNVATVQRCEDGTTYPRLERIVAWANACGVRPGWLQWNIDACGQPDMHFALDGMWAPWDSNPQPAVYVHSALTSANVCPWDQAYWDLGA